MPWCESCEWNLDVFDPRRRGPGWRWIDRLTFDWALRRSMRDFAVWARDGVHRPRRATWLALQAVSAALLAGWALLLFTGVRLVLTEVNGWLMIGVLCLALSYGLRPRFRGAGTAGPVGPDGRGPGGVAVERRAPTGAGRTAARTAAPAVGARGGLAVRLAPAERPAGTDARGAPGRPPQAALVELTAEQNARMDAELASRFEELRQAVSAR
ncbi:hypothetical protein GCM10028775_38140 [Catellatospora paridis]